MNENLLNMVIHIYIIFKNIWKLYQPLYSIQDYAVIQKLIQSTTPKAHNQYGTFVMILLVDPYIYIINYPKPNPNIICNYTLILICGSNPLHKHNGGYSFILPS